LVRFSYLEGNSEIFFGIHKKKFEIILFETFLKHLEEPKAVMQSDWFLLKQKKEGRKKGVRIACKRAPEKRIWGLTQLLRRAYFAHFHYSSQGNRDVKKTKRGGKREGKRVDRAISRRIDLGVKEGAKEDEEEEEKKEQVYFEFLQKNGYKVLCSQLGVGSLSKGIGTMIDVVATVYGEEEKGVVLIENKVRQLLLYDRGSGHTITQGNKQKVPRAVVDSPRNQDQLQLAFSLDLFRKTFPNIPVAGAMILVMHSEGILHVPLEKQYWKLSDESWKPLLQVAQKWNAR
jgi:hypothetical protein